MQIWASRTWEQEWWSKQTEETQWMWEMGRGADRWRRVNGRGYTHSIVAGVALREPSCQFSTGTGMQVSLMVSWQRRDRGGPLSSSSWALLWTVSTIEGGGGAEGGGFRGREARYTDMGVVGQEAERGGGRKEDKEDTKTYEARTTEHETGKQSQALSRAHFFELLLSHILSDHNVLRLYTPWHLLLPTSRALRSMEFAWICRYSSTHMKNC